MKSFWLLLAAVSISGVKGQEIEWERSYGGKHADYLSDVIATPDYGFILAGSSSSGKNGNKEDRNEGNLDYWLWKMNEKGNLEWQKSFGGSGNDMLKLVRSTADGGFIMAGDSNSPKSDYKRDDSRGDTDFWIIKIDAGGGETWQKNIGGNGQEKVSCLIQTADQGYLVGGSSNSGISGDKTDASRGNMDFWIVKLDKAGKIEWQKTYGGSKLDVLNSVCKTKNGGYLLAGTSNSPISGEKNEECLGLNDYWVISVDAIGDVIWQRTIGGSGADDLTVVVPLDGGSYLLGGSSNSGAGRIKDRSSKDTDFWMLKINEYCMIIWQEVYNYGRTDVLTSIVENKDQSLVIGGYSQSEVMGTGKKDKKGINDYIMLKTDPEGKELWTQTVGSDGDDMLKKAIETRDGGYILGGTSNGKASRDRNTSRGGNDFWVAKIKDKQKKKQERVYIEAFPNPTNQYSNVIIGYEYSQGTCSLYDLAGRRLQSFSIQGQTIPVNLATYPVGIYLVEIATNVQTNSVKLMKAD